MDKFDLEAMYQNYLKMVKLPESSMATIQKIETKRAFMGACASMLSVLREDIPELPEKEAVEKLDSMWKQVGKFWKNEKNR